MLLLTDPWARRSFALCCQAFDALQPAAPRLADHLVERASGDGLAPEPPPGGAGRKAGPPNPAVPGAPR